MGALPIDRGWAWVITFASCGMFGFVTGSYKIRGIILVEVQERFPEASTLSIIWMLNVNYLFDRLLGPFYGWVLSRTSNRIIALMGTSIAVVGLIAFAYAPSIPSMYAAYGLYGFGSGFISLSALTSYQPYFNKRKALSLGITGSGSGIYTIILSALLRFFFDNFSFSGAILLYAGVGLHTIAMAMLLRPFSFYDRKKKTHLEEETPVSTQEHVRKRRWSADEKSSSVDEVAEFRSMPDKLDETSLKEPAKLSTLEIMALSTQDVSSAAYIGDEPSSGNQRRSEEKQSLNWKLIYNPRCIMLGLCVFIHVSALMATHPSIPPLGRQTGVNKKLVSTLLAASGGVEIFMRIANGWFTDRKFISAYTQLTISMFLTGATALLCAIIAPYSGTAGIVLVAVGNISFGTPTFTILPVVCGELFGKENVKSGMAIVFVYQGLSIILSSFGAGEIYEIRKRWEDVFYFIAASMLTASLLMFATAAISRCMKKRSMT